MSQNGAGVGVTPGIAGAYSEYFLLDEQLLLPVPDHLPTAAAAVTEPLAVGLHAVNRSSIAPGDVALVAGCGPIGLAVIAALRRRGVSAIVASDLQAGKLETAQGFGASHVVNPRDEDEVALAADLAGEGRVVIFECIGVHQLIADFIRRAPAAATLVITGVHTADSQINYAYATVKELDVKFSYYYNPEEFAECLDAIADGELPWQSMLTGSVGIDGVASAFDTLSGPNDHIKVIVEPWRSGGLESTRL
jgi:threonine dehydrogenase-like Zn-dependent dehydrogenase